jgi:nucleoside-diphosphate-sugar epimerase
MGARILLIGGTRFIGAHAARRFALAGADVTVFHRGKSQNAILPARVEHVRDAAAEYPITRFPQALTARDWDVVVHMVAMGEEDARAAVAAFAGRTGRLVLISSGDVYRAYGRLTGHEPGPPDPVPLTEDAPLRRMLYPYRAHAGQMGAYARDYEKILAEAAVRAGALSYTILRLPKVYGPEDNADLATVYGFAGQPQWRWTHGHVENVAHAIALSAMHPVAVGRIYNVGEAPTPTMGERLARLPVRAAPAKLPPFDYRQDMAVDTSRIRTELGYGDVVDEAAGQRSGA